MKNWFFAPLGAAAICMLAGCGGGGSAAPAGNAIPNAFLSNSEQPDAVAEAVLGDVAKVIYVGFGHKALPKSKYGPVAFYAPTKGATAVITVKANSKVSFYNDDTTRHTASGLGSDGFPASFDNTSGLNQVGKVINSTLTWSTGSLNPKQTSIVFTVGKKGTYYFGCYFHYRVSPAMRDVLVSD
jgi:plastocyanin